jgi:hypothetical protein
MSAQKTQNVQDLFLNHLRKHKNSGLGIPRQWGQNAGHHYLVRQFQPIAAARYAFATGLQTRDLGRDADAADRVP